MLLLPWCSDHRSVAGLLPCCTQARQRADGARAREGYREPDELRMRNGWSSRSSHSPAAAVGATALSPHVRALMQLRSRIPRENVLTLHGDPAKNTETTSRSPLSITGCSIGLSAAAGVASAAMINRLPLSGNDMALRFELEDVAGSPQQLQTRSTTPDYFRTMAIPLRAGRGLTEQDTASAPMAGVIDERAARTLWPGQNPVGKRYTVTLPGQLRMEGRIVGVVGAVRHAGLDSADAADVLTYHQSPRPHRARVRGHTAVHSLVPAVR